MRTRSRPGRARALAIALLPLLAAACTERSITSPDESGAPGQGSPTVEITLRADSMAMWHDTTFSGFDVPGTVPFLVGAKTDSLESRPLMRFGSIPDSLLLDSMNFVADSFQDAQLRLVYDTTGLQVPAGGATFRAYALSAPFDSLQATWQQASDGRAWGTPGGDLGPLLAVLQMKPPGTDTIVNDTIAGKSKLPADSLLQAWRKTGGGDGIVVVPSTPGTRVRFIRFVLATHFRAVSKDTTMTEYQYLQATTTSFIYDPPQPALQASEMRLGGVPSSRGYFEFVPPDSAGGYGLRGAQISRAELVLHPLPAPAAPFALDRAVTAGLTGLGADFLKDGPKTPIVSLSTASAFVIYPDSLARGTSLVLDVTRVLRAWASTPADSTPAPLRMGLRLLPDGQALGYWSFGSGEAALKSQPELRLFITPPVPFTAP